jgi:pimeloyl-ACP methyl ester carboxylesterase
MVDSAGSAAVPEGEESHGTADGAISAPPRRKSDLRLVGGTRWWQRLPENFYRYPDGTEVDTHHPLKVHGSAFADRMLRTGLASLITIGMAPSLLSSARARRERNLLPLYRELADRGDADAVFAPPPNGVTLRQRDGSRSEWQPRGIAVRQLSFESPYVPVHPEMRQSWRAQSRNRVARAQHWMHPRGARPTLVFVHGFMLDAYAANSWGFSLPWLFKKGYDILLVTLPFHGARREAGHPFSGYGFVSGGMAHLNESMLQSIQELRIWLDYLFEQGAPQVGISGLSLGGYLSALLAAVDPRLAFCIPNSPVVAPVDMAMEWQPIRPLLKTVMWRDKVRISEFRHGMALHSPLTYAPKVDPERLLVIGGAGDRVTPPRFVRLLHQHWRGSELHWFPGNHIVHLHQANYLRMMKRFMDRHTG